ncbi:MAG: sodium:proton antiporter [Chloroflexota bacterium]|nr:sodium:proton antiporter [Chloroflexota bacterium]
MDTIGFAAILLSLLVSAAISRRIQGTIITLPMVYVTLGLLIGSKGLGLVTPASDSELIHLVAELTLVIVLASDASRISAKRLLREHELPARLLGIGLPLTMLLGTVVALVMFPRLNIWTAAILAISLAPTDASLGLAVVSNPKVPVRIRQALNIESGLNDGIAMPFLFLAIALAVASNTFSGPLDWIMFAVRQMVLGLIAGVVVGYLGFHFIAWGNRSKWMSRAFRKAASVAVILLAYALAELIGGSGFIAAFCLGITAGNLKIRDDAAEDIVEFVEVEVQVLILLTFVLFGAVLLPQALDQVDGAVVIYAIISLTLIRMVPVAISLRGTTVRPATTLFLGWFGPRGTASIIYVFTVLESKVVAGSDLIFSAALLTVFLSVFAHGITAAPLSKRYGDTMRKFDAAKPGTAEMAHRQEPRLRAHPPARNHAQ